jgi:hypothetical protein
MDERRNLHAGYLPSADGAMSGARDRQAVSTAAEDRYLEGAAECD